jgi:hypothetical protein
MNPKPLALAAALVFVAWNVGAKEKRHASPQKAGASAEGEAPAELAPESGLLEPDTQLVDVPTAGILDERAFSTRTRFFNGGGVVEWIDFGLVHRVNLGASLNVDKLIGTASPVQVTRPEIQIKCRFYDGTRLVPALAAGFDGQGYLYNRSDKRYNQKQRGLYLVGSQEIFWPGLQGHAGMNISDFDKNSVFGFLSTSLNLQDALVLMAEWDNISDFDNSRVNLGLRVYVTPAAYVAFAVRGVGQGGSFPDGMTRAPDRIFQFKFTGSF